IDVQARRMVEMAGYLIMSYLLLNDANKDEKLFRKSAEVYLNYTQAEVKKNASFIRNFDIDEMAFYRYDFEEKKVEEEVTA
ncbi:MAG: Acyl-CoA dehydrogenase C-terminal domain-containing protein, partial [Bacteroidales bacterium]